MADILPPSSVLGTYAGAVADLIAQQGSTAYSYGLTGTDPNGYPTIDLAAGSQPTSYTDCSGWLSYALASVAPVHAAVLSAARTEDAFNRQVTLSDNTKLTLDETHDWSWARADVLSTKFAEATGANGFTPILSFANLTGGDVIAYSTGIYALLQNPDTTADPSAKLPDDTGHTMIVTKAPMEVPEEVWNDGSGDQPPDIVTVWAVSVVDSSDVHHFGNRSGFPTPQADVRDYNNLATGAPNGSKAGGVGRGTIWFAQDAQGNITHFRFADLPKDHWIPNTDVWKDDKALLIAAVRPTSTIDLGATDLVNGQLQVRTYPNAQDTIDGQTYSLAEQLTGQAGLAVSGGGTLRLSAGNTFIGAVSVSDADTTLSIDADSALGGDGNALTLGDGTVLQFTGAVAFAHKLTLIGDATITLAPGSSSGLAGEVDGSGTSLVVVKGGGTLALNGQLSGIDEVWTSGPQTTLALNGSANTAAVVLRMDHDTGLVVSGIATLAKLVAGTVETITLTNKATLVVTNGLHQPSDAVALTHITVAGDGRLVIQENGMTRMTITGGHSLWSGTLAQLDGTSLSGFTAGDVIDVTDAGSHGTGRDVTAVYDNASGRLVLHAPDAGPMVTLTLPPGLKSDNTGPRFSVQTDGAQGSVIGLTNPIRAQDSDALGATAARTAHGLTGAGVVVGIISDSFDTLGGMAQDVADGLLPRGITILQGYDVSGLDEGREMAQVVHSIAPDATIVFASSYGQGGLAGAIAALQNAHVNVIVDDLDDRDANTWGTGGATDAAVQQAMDAGITLVTSAGNTGANYYERSSYSLTASNSRVLGDASAFDFDLGRGQPNYFQKLEIAQTSSKQVLAVFNWDDPSAKLDMRVFTVDANGLFVPAQGVTDTLSPSQTQRIVTFPATANVDYYVSVVGNSTASGRFKYVLHNDDGANVFGSNPDANKGTGAISGHALSPAEITVGAVKVDGAHPADGSVPANEISSSPGATPFDADGNPVTLNLGKPDVSGVDGAPSDVFAAAPAFFGTSAAAPSVAGVVALLLQANPNLTPTQVKAALKASARPTVSAVQGGSGLVQANAAVSIAVPPQISSIAATPDTTSGPLGLGHTVSFTLHASTALSVTAAADGSLPTLALDNGGTATLDTAASSGCDLVFHTTIGAGQSSAALTVTTLGLNGSMLQNVATLQLADGSLSTVTGAQTGLAVAMQPETASVFRFFDSSTGTHFFTSSADERASILATRPDMVPEGQDGIGMLSVNPDSGDAYAAPVFRFFDTVHGTQFLTTSATERDSVLANRPDLTYESASAFYEHIQPQAGDTPVYRFFSSTDGTHFYTDSASERASILQTRPDLVAEGIGFYEPGRTGT